MLSFHKTQCCAIQELSGLQDYSWDNEGSKRIIDDFCSHVFSEGVRFGGTIGIDNTTYSLYLFTAALRSKLDNTSYGPRLASFIRDNKLGKVIGSPSISNEAFHPGRYNKVWLWIPDVRALRIWYESMPAKENCDVGWHNDE